MLKKSEFKLVYILFILLFLPIVHIKNHNIALSELFVYYIFFSNYNLKKFLKKQRDKFNFLVKRYLFFYFLIIIFTAILNFQIPYNSNLYVLRKIIQFSFLYYYFSSFIKREISDTSKINKLIRNILLVATIPAIITIIEYFNFGGLRQFFYDWFKPTYYFEPNKINAAINYENLGLNRVTSIFKDFFTATNYFLFVATYAFYLLISTNKRKLYYFCVISLNFSATLLSGRTGVVFTPIAILFISFFYAFRNRFSPQKIFNMFLIFIILLIILFSVTLYLIRFFDTNTYFWLLKVVSLLGIDTYMDFSSFNSMLNNNYWFWKYLYNNWDLLFHPKHAYIGYYGIGWTIDSFYLQEIYRYGIYGLLNYAIFVIGVLKKYYKNIFIVTIFVIFSIVNYKGGNIFWADRVIYLTSLIFAIEISLYER